ncbi:hypothetical protein KI387_012484 [Taxus chinensis]|uniref:Uncharacterized protein n=1 Tax=Taxus chinensis TaxID=29808 RepID=A0AA38CJZ6_TAXCH|nr:hypothetical protein KI387_012484 [Taxus chinensis]
MDAKDVNRPIQPKWETSAPGQVGQKDAWDADSRESRGPIRSRHMLAGRKGTWKPISGGSEVFVPDSLGHPGQKDAMDAKIRQAHGRITA